VSAHYILWRHVSTANNNLLLHSFSSSQIERKLTKGTLVFPDFWYTLTRFQQLCLYFLGFDPLQTALPCQSLIS
jgi:hypothetical protein